MAEKDERCQVAMWGGASCGRELYDEAYCIFHSLQPDKDEGLFQKKLDEIFKEESFKIYDFSKFIFPKEISFPSEIDRKVRFSNAIFLGKADFYGITFLEDVSFFETLFQDVVTFNKANFQRDASFFDAVFEAYANFEDVHFATVSFERATFRGSTNFEGALIEDRADFSITTFQNDVSFMGVAFKGSTGFVGAILQNKADFSAAIFEDEFAIIAEDNNKIFAEKEVNFSYVGFLKPEKVSFTKVDLSKFRFIGTDLRKVEFLDVSWDTKKGRNRIYDETVAYQFAMSEDFELPPIIEKPDYSLVAQVYKRLRANYEENLNYAEAGDFHIGEMEMRRKGEKNPFNKAVIWLYKLISNYGESYWLPLGWIALLLIVFPFLYMLVGIVPPAQINGSQSLEKLKDYWSSFTYSLSVFSLVRERPYHTINNLGHILTILESIFSPVMIAFFLLALRRRFKR